MSYAESEAQHTESYLQAVEKHLSVDNKVHCTALFRCDELAKAISEGYVREQRHPSLPLRILNYTEKAQFDNCWNEVTTNCRALILDDNGFVVARPYPKFHNINTSSIPETHEANLPWNAPMDILEKLDGFLAVYWEYEFEGKKHWGVASRGSFTSPHSVWATKWYADTYCDTDHKNWIDWPEGYTPVFEGLHEDFRIVCKYDYNKLVLTGLVNKATAHEYSHQQLADFCTEQGVDFVPRHHKLWSDIMVENRPNHEGYVVSFYMGEDKAPLKVKIKHEEYVALHRVVTGVNPKHIWELLSSASSMSDFDTMPSHFKEWAHDWRIKLQAEFKAIEAAAVEVFINRPFHTGSTGNYRKDCAMYFQRIAPKKLHSALFAMMDGKDWRSALWKQLKPESLDSGHTFRIDGGE